jgi:hypothetical protein
MNAVEIEEATSALYFGTDGHVAISALGPLSGVKQNLDFGAVKSAFDPTRTLPASRGQTGRLWS